MVLGIHTHYHYQETLPFRSGCAGHPQEKSKVWLLAVNEAALAQATDDLTQ
jgi:hypothetical protein